MEIKCVGIKSKSIVRLHKQEAVLSKAQHRERKINRRQNDEKSISNKLERKMKVGIECSSGKLREKRVQFYKKIHNLHTKKFNLSAIYFSNVLNIHFKLSN